MPVSLYTAFILPGLLLAPPASAISLKTSVDVIVAVGWVGPECVSLNEPDPRTGRTTVTRTITCVPEQAVAIQYSGHRGEFVGVDVVAAPNLIAACEVQVDGVIVMQESGASITCLSRLL